MKITLNDKDGIVLQTNKKYCKEDIEVDINSTSLNVTPTSEEQIFEGLYDQVIVEAGLDTTDATATAEDILEGKTAYVNGEKLVGQLVNDYNAMIDPSRKTTSTTLSACITQISWLDTENMTNMDYMFSGFRGLQTIPLIDTSKVTSMVQMFNNCTSLITIPLLDTSKVTSMRYMFNNCTSLITIPQLDTSNVTDMIQMFYGCSYLITIPQLDTSNVTNMSEMLRNSVRLTTIPPINTSKVTNMWCMFNSCSSLVDIPQLDMSNVTSINGMFNYCSKLSDESLNNIMTSLITAVKITSNKTLSYVGLTPDQVTKCQSLSNYQALLDVGWTTGY